MIHREDLPDAKPLPDGSMRYMDLKEKIPCEVQRDGMRHHVQSRHEETWRRVHMCPFDAQKTLATFHDWKNQGFKTHRLYLVDNPLLREGYAGAFM